MKISALAIFTLLLLTACSESSKQETKTTSILDSKIDMVHKAQASVSSVNKKTETMQTQIIKTTKSPSGAFLYAQKCASCHGKEARKTALNSSEAIAGWSSTKTQNALKGYKSGNYGGKMKGVMQGQSKPLSDSDIKLISDYISIL